MTNEQNIAEQIRQLTSRIIYLEGEVSLLKSERQEKPDVNEESVGTMDEEEFCDSIAMSLLCWGSGSQAPELKE